MRNNHHVVFTVPEVRGAPIDLNDFAFDTALWKDRVAGKFLVGFRRELSVDSAQHREDERLQ